MKISISDWNMSKILKVLSSGQRVYSKVKRTENKESRQKNELGYSFRFS